MKTLLILLVAFDLFALGFLAGEAWQRSITPSVVMFPLIPRHTTSHNR